MSAEPITTTDIVVIAIACLLGAYLLAGLCVVGYIFFFRNPVWSRYPRTGMLWEPRYHRRSTGWWLLALSIQHPLGLALSVVLWPLWYAAHLDAKHAEEEAAPRYVGPTSLDDDTCEHDKV